MKKSIKIGLVRDKGGMADTIRWFGKLKTGDARFNHVFLLIDDTFVVEEQFYGLRIVHISKYKERMEKGYTYFEVYVPTFLGEAQRVRIEKESFTQVGTHNGIYGYTKFPLFILDAIFKTYVFTKYIGIKHFMVCSQFVCYMLYKFGCYEPFSNWRSMSPDDIDDYMKEHQLLFKRDFKY